MVRTVWWQYPCFQFKKEEKKPLFKALLLSFAYHFPVLVYMLTYVKWVTMKQSKYSYMCLERMLQRVTQIPTWGQRVPGSQIRACRWLSLCPVLILECSCLLLFISEFFSQGTQPMIYTKIQATKTIVYNRQWYLLWMVPDKHQYVHCPTCLHHSLLLIIIIWSLGWEDILE